MIRRTRLRIGLYLAAMLLLVAVSLTAYATTPVLESHMRAFVYWTLGITLFSVVGSAAAFTSYLMARMERTLEASINRLERAVERQGMDLLAHNASAFSHTAASEHNHGPMHEQMGRIEIALGEVNVKANTLVEGQKVAVAELTEQDARLVSVEDKLLTLCTEHRLMHGKRVGDKA